MAKMGIYSITNTVTKKIYIGSSKNITARINHHKGLLRKKKHSNDDMISDWSEYGEASFKFEILELVSNENILLSREEFWIKETICNGNSVYNKVVDVGKYRRCYVGIGREVLNELRIMIRQNSQAALTLSFFLEHMDNENIMKCSYKFIQEYFKCSRMTAYRGVKFLVDNGYVSILKNGNSNSYLVNKDAFCLTYYKACA